MLTSMQKVIPMLSKDYSVDTVRNALIRHWAQTNKITIDMLHRGMMTGIFISDGISKEYNIVLRQLKGTVPSLSLKNLESIFEGFMDQKERQVHGAVYTPDFIIDYLVGNALSMGWENREALPRLCDPSCGSGGFLIRAAEILHKDYGVSLEQAFAQSLVGIDIDPWALKHARCLIELYMATKGIQLPGPELRLINRDTLLSSPADLWEASGIKVGFDVVVTNPPYVKLQNLEPEYRVHLARKYSDFVRGNFSLAPLFLVAGHKLLASGGCLAMITQNNLFTSLAGKQVRQYLQQEKCVRRIMDFGHQKIFEKASAYTCLIFLGTEHSEGFEYESLSNAEKANSAVLEKAHFSFIRFEYLKPGKWRLAKERHLENLWRIESTGRPLGEVASIKVGFATLKDSVFLVRSKGEHCTGKLRDGNVSIEPEVTRPVVKISELHEPEDLIHNTLRVIFPYEKINGKYRIIPERQLKGSYPGAYSYLLYHKDVLQTRDKGKKKYESWYAWGRTQGMEAPGPKLLTKTFSRQPQFLYDSTGQLFCNGYSVFPKGPSLFSPEVPIEVLERILNSKLMYYYAKLTSFQLEGDYQCYQKNFIERFGIVDLTRTQMDSLLHKKKSEVDRYLARLYGVSMEDMEDILGG